MKSITRTTWTELDYEFLRKNYLTMSNGEISEALGKTKSAIQNKLKVLGLKRPDKYTYQQNYFENIDSEHKAYWLGFFYADGYVNKTDSAVRFTHLPTGIVVACQSERSQIMNRQSCMNMLKARLYEYYREQKEKENSKFAAEKKEISFGSQIRSYVFCPYTMVKDLRTRYSVGNIQAVMDGDLDEFMNAYLVAKWKGLPMDGADDDDDEE